MTTSPTSSDRRPSLSDFAARAIDAWMRGVFRARPGKITKWEANKQRANVKPLVKLPYVDEEGNRQVESDAIVTGVPVIFPGAGPVRITFPISDGTLVIGENTIAATKGLLIWCDCSLDKWLSGGGGEVDPEFDHRDGHNDAVFIAGFNPFGAPLGDVPTDYMSVGFDGGMQIKVKKSTIEMGEQDATNMQLVALANLVKNNHDDIKSVLDSYAQVFGSHTHEWAGFSSGTTDPPNASMTNTYSVTDTAAANVKAEQ